MYAKLEPSGFAVRRGKVQLRISFYLEPMDARYNEHHVNIPIIPPEGYQGECDPLGSPIDQQDYVTWIESLPKAWQNNPFHNHFIRVEPDITDTEIKLLMQRYLEEFYAIWSSGESILQRWKPKPARIIENTNPNHVQACEAKLVDITNRFTEF